MLLVHTSVPVCLVGNTEISVPTMKIIKGSLDRKWKSFTRKKVTVMETIKVEVVWEWDWAAANNYGVVKRCSNFRGENLLPATPAMQLLWECCLHSLQSPMDIFLILDRNGDETHLWISFVQAVYYTLMCGLYQS